jgi:hypothetical protein
VKANFDLLLLSFVLILACAGKIGVVFMGAPNWAERRRMKPCWWPWEARGDMGLD